MNLTSQEVKRFYRIWWPLLRFVNAKEQIIAELLDALPRSLLDIDADNLEHYLNDGTYDNGIAGPW